MLDFKYGDPVWHSTHGFGTVLRQWPLCPCNCLDVQFDDKVEFVLPADLQLVMPLAERFPSTGEAA